MNRKIISNSIGESFVNLGLVESIQSYCLYLYCIRLLPSTIKNVACAWINRVKRWHLKQEIKPGHVLEDG